MSEFSSLFCFTSALDTIRKHCLHCMHSVGVAPGTQLILGVMGSKHWDWIALIGISRGAHDGRVKLGINESVLYLVTNKPRSFHGDHLWLK